jgi:hypothetical protein
VVLQSNQDVRVVAHNPDRAARPVRSVSGARRCGSALAAGEGLPGSSIVARSDN